MIESKKLDVGLLIWWTAERHMNSWSCPGVVTYLNESENKFRVRTFDTMEETNDLLITRPEGGDKSSLEEMEVTSEKKVLDYISKKENSFNMKVFEKKEELKKCKREALEYSKKASIVRQKLEQKTPEAIMP